MYEAIAPHETMRKNGDLTIFDNYGEFATFCASNPVVFVSHQWLSDTAPDPDNHQFKLILEVCTMLCIKLNISLENLYIWIDYCSIPQANRTLQYYAISSLHVYASCVRYFLVVAPPVVHTNGRMCDAKSYRSRGWCRLELLAKMSSGNFDNMYIASENSSVKAITDGDLELWMEAATGVFSGNYTQASDMKKIVDVCLGLWALILQQMDLNPDVRKLYDSIKDQVEEIFPPALFGDMPQKLRQIMFQRTNGDKGKKSSISFSGTFNAKSKKQNDELNKIVTQGLTEAKKAKSGEISTCDDASVHSGESKGTSKSEKNKEAIQRKLAEMTVPSDAGTEGVASTETLPTTIAPATAVPTSSDNPVAAFLSQRFGFGSQDKTKQHMIEKSLEA